MAGIGQDAAPVSVPEGPLVSPSVLPDQNAAVQNMIDAFHKGFITSQDIVDRIGDRGQAQKKALLESLGEYVSPDAIQSRMSAYRAAGAQSNLTGQTAQAQLAAGVPQAGAQLTAADIASKTAGINYGPVGAQAFDQYAPWFHEPVPTLPNGAVDFKTKIQRGNEMSTQMGAANYWLDLMTPVKQEKIEVSPGVTELHEFNRMGTDVTAPNPQFGIDGSDAYKAYLKRVQDYLPEGHPLYHKLLPGIASGESAGMPDNAPPNPHSLNSLIGAPPVPVSTAPTVYAGTTPQGAPVVGSEPAQISAGRAQLVNRGLEPTAVNQLTPDQVQNLVTPATPTLPGVPPTAPVIQPPPATPTTPPVVHGGIPLTVGGQQMHEARASMFTDPTVKKWSEDQEVYQKFAGAAKQASTNPNSVNDLALAESFTKMFDPTARITEFKFDALKKVAPLYELIKDAAPIIERDHIFPPAVRQRIIDSGFQNADSADRTAAPSFAQAEARKPGVLDSRQRAAVAGIPFRSQVGYDSAATANGGVPNGVPPGSVPMNIPGRPNVWKAPNGQYFEPKQ